VPGQHLSCLAGAAIASVHRAAHHTAEPASAQHSGHFHSARWVKLGRMPLREGRCHPAAHQQNEAKRQQQGLQASQVKKQLHLRKGYPYVLPDNLLASAVCASTQRYTLAGPMEEQTHSNFGREVG